FLAGQVLPPGKEDFVSRVSIPGFLTDRTVRLFSGQVVPILEPHVRGMAAWNEHQLIDAAMEAVRQAREKQGLAPLTQDEYRTARSLFLSFLQRLYYELRNLGQTSQERALNYSATNAFQAGSIMAEQAEKVYEKKEIYGGLFELDSISTE